MLTADRLRELLDYDPATGVFTWRTTRRGKALAGAAAGCLRRGYRVISVEDRDYFAHRLAWLYVYGAWPTLGIDHISGVKDDNRLVNLREASQLQNCANRGVHSNNAARVKGVRRLSSGRWQVRIMRDYRPFHLGSFDTLEAAKAAYAKAAEFHFGSFARTA